MNTQKKKVVVGLSGGVDSSLSAALLVEQGYDVTGVFLECWRAPGCRVDSDRKDALDIALQLGIPFKVLDFKDQYKATVVDYFYKEYEAGRTPNPDTMCNREIKFGLFYDWAVENGFDFVATGHYARILQMREAPNSKSQVLINTEIKSSDGQNGVCLQRGKDTKKDQSYFLYLLKPEQFAHILFPIGGMLKSEVRAEAEKRNLKTAAKPDSQGICFIGEINVHQFLKERIEEKSGDIVLRLSDSELAKIKSEEFKFKTTSERLKLINLLTSQPINSTYIVIGQHTGVPFYTIGQKIGRGLDGKWLARLFEEGLIDIDPRHLPDLFVISKDVEKNILVVGIEADTYGNTFQISEFNLLTSQPIDQLTSAYIRIRHGGDLVKAQLNKENEKLQVKLDRSVRGIAPGQAAVLYSDNTPNAVVLGGGIIS